MKRLPILLLALVAVVILGVFSSIVGHGFEELTRAEDERSRLENRKNELAESIDELEQTLNAIRTDPDAVESIARRELGMVRPGDVVILLTTPTPPPAPSFLTGPVPTPILSLPK
jgi:cell division protein FtsB